MIDLPEPQLSSTVDNNKINKDNNNNNNTTINNTSQGNVPDFPVATAELSVKPPQRPDLPPTSITRARKPSMDDPEDDPWNTPDVHKHHTHTAVITKTNGLGRTDVRVNGSGFSSFNDPEMHSRTTSNFTTTSIASASASQSGGSVPSTTPGWDYFGGTTTNPQSFGDASQNQVTSPFGGGNGNGGAQGARDPGANPPAGHSRTISGPRTGSAVGENITVTLMPEKEGLFMFQHHNYEVTSVRRGSKVIRRYSDFVWLLDCLHKRYPFRVLPLLPPKRVAVNGNHLSNDGAFIEKRRRGLARFLNAVIRHPVLGQEQLVIMFLTVPTVCPDRARLDV
jgi:sorting nexin-8